MANNGQAVENDEDDRVEDERERMRNPEERKRTRQYYRNFVNQIEEDRESYLEPAQDGQKKLTETLDEVTSTFTSRVVAPREAVLDAGVVKQIATLANENAMRCDEHAAAQFSLEDFIRRICAHVRKSNAAATAEQDTMWQPKDFEAFDKLCRLTCLPDVTFLSCAIAKDESAAHETSQTQGDAAQTEKNKRALEAAETRKRRHRELEEARGTDGNTAQQITDVQQLGDTGDGSVREMLNTFKHLRSAYEANAERPISFFELCFNPSSFSETVENLFQIAFLVKNENCRLSDAPNGQILVEPIGKKVQLGGARNAAGDERELSETARKVLVLNLTKDLYRRVCRQFNIRKCLIETRDSSMGDGVDDPDEEDGTDGSGDEDPVGGSASTLNLDEASEQTESNSNDTRSRKPKLSRK